MEVLRRLSLDPNALAAAGVRVYKVGLVFPLEPTRMIEFAQGLEEILVIEEKAPVVERQIKELLYALPDVQRARIAGKTMPDGATPLVSALGELRPSRIMPVVADWLARLNPLLDRRHLVVDFTMPALLSQRRRRGQAPALFLLRLPAQLEHQGARRLARAGRHRLPFHGELDGARDRAA